MNILIKKIKIERIKKFELKKRINLSYKKWHSSINTQRLVVSLANQSLLVTHHQLVQAFIQHKRITSKINNMCCVIPILLNWIISQNCLFIKLIQSELVLETKECSIEKEVFFINKKGWPESIDPTEQQQYARFMKKIDKDQNFAGQVKALCEVA